MKNIHTVTGAFGYSGKYISRLLLDRGLAVQTLTNSTDRKNPFGKQIKISAYNFNNPDLLAKSLENTEVLYNTYWVRFNHQDAVKNSLLLFDAAKRAGVKKIVHTSITNPSLDSDLEYFKGKAELEQALIESGLGYSILRPAVLFGHEDILINNIAWTLRYLPVFGIFGDGQYKLRPIHVEDFASLAVEQGENNQNVIINAVGPETFSFKDLVHTIGKIIGKSRPIIPVHPLLGYLSSKIIGSFVGDTFITREEIEGLMQNLLYVDTEATGKIILSEWAKKNSETLGIKYASELGRRRNLKSSYAEIAGKV